jgi:hypothetical protein
MIGESAWLEKFETSLRKKHHCGANLQKNLHKSEKLYPSCFVTLRAYILVCQGYKCKLWWRGRPMSWASFQCDTYICLIAWINALLSHDDDLLPHEILSVLSYDLCDSPSITVIQTICFGGLHMFVYYISTFTNHVVITCLRGYGMIRFGVTICLHCLRVCEQERDCQITVPCP